ncbi:hypothetical protein Taro_024757 [Colocasia esculenta]|uniref:BTB domain-containing protein n=1 Tax=Colocasia esculenta TaxID=4460 RepID=A0A843VEJ2_COLES|nr:hypothetical protein [Colocasia esculenta]
MDCCICSPLASVFRPPRNSICASCFEGGKCMMGFLGKLENEEPNERTTSPSNIEASAFKWMKEMKETEHGLLEKVEFLGGFAVALREAMHPDILVQPGGGGPPIPAHRALLAARSDIFHTVLGSDECKAPASGAISLPELDHEQLLCLLEFLYRGSLPEEDAERHAYALLLAADKYDIPFLRKFCERRVLGSLSPANALDVLEVSEACANERLKRSAMATVVEHAEEVVFSCRYEEFALRNVHLCVEITRVLLRRGKAENRAAVQCEEKVQGPR